MCWYDEFKTSAVALTKASTLSHWIILTNFLCLSIISSTSYDDNFSLWVIKVLIWMKKSWHDIQSVAQSSASSYLWNHFRFRRCWFSLLCVTRRNSHTILCAVAKYRFSHDSAINICWQRWTDLDLFVCFSSQSGNFSEDMIPTVGFNMRKVTKGNVTIKVWGEQCKNFAQLIADLIMKSLFSRHWRPAQISIHVGAILSWRERNRLHGRRSWLR